LIPFSLSQATGVELVLENVAFLRLLWGNDFILHSVKADF